MLEYVGGVLAELEARVSDGAEKLDPKLVAIDLSSKFWLLATSAEANFGLGDFTKYAQVRADAVAASDAGWMVQAMDAQIDQLQTLLTRHGHLLDPPWRAPRGAI